MIKLPGQVGYRQTNRSDTLGSFWSTFNIDLHSNLGKVRVSPRLKINTQTSDDADFGCPVAISPFNNLIYTIAGGRIFTNADYPNDPFTEDASTNAATDYSADYSDLAQFNDVLFSTSDDTLRSLNSPGGTWTDRDTFSSTDEVHKLCYFKKLNRLYWTHNEQFINSCGTDYTPADSGDFTLSWNGLVAATDIKASSDFIWMAGKVDNISRTDVGVVWRWDGIATFKEFKVQGTTGIFALAIDPERDSPVAMGDNGILYQFNGSGFTEMGRLPYTNQLPFAGSAPISTSNKNDRFIHPNGLAITKNGTVLALINGKNNDNGATQNENLPSGIWEWSRENGFIHKYSFSYDPITSSITDYGQGRVSRVGALALLNVPNTAAGRDGTLLAGATVFTDASSTTNAIFFDNSIDTVQKYGYLVTTKILSSQIEDTWQGIYVRHKKLLDSADSIAVKYRTSDVAPTEITITWTSSNTFTTTTDVDNKTGYEVEILQGKGGGKCAHITSVVNNAGTRTVTLDDTFTGATSGTAKARLQDWKKIGTQTDQTLKYFRSSIDQSDTWAQLKVCMQFKGTDEIDDFILTQKTQEPAT